MNIAADIWNSPTDYLAARHPDHPVHFFAPAILQAKAQVFVAGFNGMVTFAVKANPDPMVISNLVAAGVNGFDVASPNEIRLILDVAPQAALHYNNPVRSRKEIQFAVNSGVKSYSVDGFNELAKLVEIVPPKEVELAVRFKLPVSGADYDFGDKFGAVPEKAIKLLQSVQKAGFTPALTFHPGTQCEDPQAWETYIIEAAKIVQASGIHIKRLNVGGGFPTRMNGNTPNLQQFFDLIKNTVEKAFGENHPPLICEPGRALVAESFVHVTRVKSVNDDGDVFLNDGIYGGLSEFPNISASRKHEVVTSTGVVKSDQMRPARIFGPTCDSIDVLPGKYNLPADIAEEDYILFHSMGAYVNGVTTDFNGYGQLETITVLALSDRE